MGSVRRHPWTPAALLVTALLAVQLAEGAADERPSILAVTPALDDSMLVCGVVTRGLPGEQSQETLASGLPSAVLLGFTVFEASGRSIGDSRAEIRIEPDLWEEVIFVRTPGYDSRLASITDVQNLLSSLQRIPVLPLAQLSRDASYRIRVRLAVQPLAPSAIRRSRDLLVGEGRMTDPGRRETSVGLNSLLRFFLGKENREDWVAEAISPLFTRRDLPRVENATPGGGEH